MRQERRKEEGRISAVLCQKSGQGGSALESPVVLVRSQQLVPIEEAALVAAHATVRAGTTISIPRFSLKKGKAENAKEEKAFGELTTHRYTLLSP